MKTWKQNLAALLVAVMILPVLPTAWALDEQQLITDSEGITRVS